MVKFQELSSKYQVPFDQYQRYFTAASCIDIVRERNSVSRYRILELGANTHKNLKCFLPNDEIVFSDVNLTPQMEVDPEFVQADGTNLPYEDGSFDFIIALDVLEHIAQDKRTDFLKEANRVSKIGTIICCPYFNEETVETENRINTYFHSISGKDYIWLQEHIDNGLPTTEEIEKTLQQCTTGFFRLYHGNLYLWEKLIVSHLNTVFQGVMQPYHCRIDEYYNKHVYGGDVISPCYRVFYCCLKNEEALCDAQRELSNQLAPNNNDRIHLRQLDELLSMQEQIVLPETIYRLQKAVEDKERHIQNITSELELERRSISTMQNQVLEQEKNFKQERIKKTTLENEINQKNIALQMIIKEQYELKSKLKHYQVHYQAAIVQREDLKRQLVHWQNAYGVISNAACWKITKPLRVVLDVCKHNRFLLLIIKGVRSVKRIGIKETWSKVLYRKKPKILAKETKYTPEELARQRSVKFPQEITLSILVPLYNTDKKMLEDMIKSVKNQTYQNWELCLADGSDADHAYVKVFCQECASRDQRIKYKKLEKNLGIAENSNACIALSSGQYIGLLDHDDLLHPAALFEVMSAICDKQADVIYTDENTFRKTPADAYCPHYKPDFAPDTLRSVNYICHFLVFSRKLLEQCGGGFRSGCNGSQDYDLILRLTEQAKKIVHIPEVLYYWRASVNSTAADIGTKPYVIEAAHRALLEHLERCGLNGEVLDSPVLSMYRIKYAIDGQPLISILIPNKDHKETLKVCIDSIIAKTTYPNYEIVVIENNSTETETFSYYQSLKQNGRIRIVTWEGSFNYSAINNFGTQHAQGDYFLLLNNDIEVVTPDWIQEMLMFAQRKDVGAVGAKLYYPDGSIQHAGVILGIGGVAGHAHKYFPHEDYGYMGRLIYAQNLSAVTGACMLISRKVYEEVGGLDPEFAVAFNDVDLCMRIRQAGYLVVWTPYAELYHYESKSRGLEDTPEKQKRFEDEVSQFQLRWEEELNTGDPYYNINLTLRREDFSIAEMY